MPQAEATLTPMGSRRAGVAPRVAGPSPKLVLAAATVLAIAFVVLPLLWAISTSLKTEVAAVAFPPSLLPRPLSLAAYWRVLTEQDFLAELSNSTLYSVGAVVLALLVAAPAGYAAARFALPGKTLIMMTILATSMIPTVALLIPLYGLLARVGLLNSAVALIVIEGARTAPQTVWFVQNFCYTVPKEIEEAAEIDGASRMQVFLYVVLPLIRPGIAAVAILGLINVWNDYLTVAVFAPDAARRTLQVAIVNQVLDSNGISWSYMMAFVLVASTPVVLMFLVAQKWFVAGLTSGGVKG